MVKTMKKNIILKKISKITIANIFLIIIIIIIIHSYIKKQETINTQKFSNYISKNYNTNNENDIYYAPYYNGNILTKTIKIDTNLNSIVSISLNRKKEIIGQLEIFGKNKYGVEGISYLESTYKNKKFECNFISNNGYKARCDILKKQTIIFEKEIKEILKKSKTKLKYIK